MMDAKLEDLVGATLDDVTVDWRNGIVRITFLPSSKMTAATAIRATDFTRVEVPRGGAGAARRVRSATRTGAVTEITMETGEVLRVESTAFALDVLGG